MRIPRHFPATPGDLAQFVLRNINSQQAQVVARFDRTLDAARISRAIRLAMDAEPVLGCRFEERWYRPRWVRREDLDQLNYCDVVETNDVDAAIDEFQLAELDPRRDPLLQARLVRSGGDVLLLKMSHVAGDGFSFGKACGIVRRFYDELAINPGFQPASNLFPRDSGPLLAELSGKQRRELLRRLWGSRRSGPLWPFSRAEGQGSAIGKWDIASETIEATTVDGAARFGRRHAATLTVVVLAALSTALQRLRPSRDETGPMVTLTVNQRHLLRGDAQLQSPCANLSGPARLCSPRLVDDDLSAILAGLNEQYRELHKAKCLGLLSPATVLSMSPFRQIVAAIPFATLKRRAERNLLRGGEPDGLRCSLSMIGDADPDSFRYDGCSALDVRAIGPSFRKLAFSVVASRYQGRLTLVLGTSDELMPADEAKKVLHGMRRALEEMAELSTVATAPAVMGSKREVPC